MEHFGKYQLKLIYPRLSAPPPLHSTGPLPRPSTLIGAGKWEKPNFCGFAFAFAMYLSCVRGARKQLPVTRNQLPVTRRQLHRLQVFLCL